MANANGVWFKVHTFREGNFLKARVHMVTAGEPTVFEVGVDMARVVRAVAAYHKKLHAQANIAGELGDCVGCGDSVDIGGLWGSIKKISKKVGVTKLTQGIAKGVKKVANNKVVKAASYLNLATAATRLATSKTAKKVLKSKVTGAAVATLAVAFPPVGVPAAASYAAANAALAAVERGNEVRKVAAKLVSKAVPSSNAKATAIAKRAVATAKKAAAIAKTTTSSQAKATATAIAKRNVATAKKAVAVAKTVATPKLSDATKKRLATALEQEKKAKSFIANAINQARYATDPAKKLEAAKTVKILEIVQANRKKVAAIETPASKAAKAKTKKNRIKGMVITETGKIVTGQFDENPLGKGGQLLYRPGKPLRGEYVKVGGGCIGCQSPWPNLH